MWSTAEYGWEGVGGKCVGEMGGDSGVVVCLFVWVWMGGMIGIQSWMDEREKGRVWRVS